MGRYISTEDKSYDVLEDVKSSDILCGKNKKFAEHPGNQLLLTVMQMFQTQYVSAVTKTQKVSILKSIIHTLQTQYGTRFVRPISQLSSSQTNAIKWQVVSNQMARDKISHAFRFKIKHQAQQQGQTTLTVTSRMSSAAAQAMSCAVPKLQAVRTISCNVSETNYTTDVVEQVSLLPESSNYFLRFGGCVQPSHAMSSAPMLTNSSCMSFPTTAKHVNKHRMFEPTSLTNVLRPEQQQQQQQQQAVANGFGACSSLVEACDGTTAFSLFDNDFDVWEEDGSFGSPVVAFPEQQEIESDWANILLNCCDNEVNIDTIF